MQEIEVRRVCKNRWRNHTKMHRYR